MSEELEGLIREYGLAVVELAIVRSELNTEDDDVDMGAVAEDAVNAAEGIATCDGEPIPELEALRKALREAAALGLEWALNEGCCDFAAIQAKADELRGSDDRRQGIRQ